VHRHFNRSYYEETLVVRVHPEFSRAEAPAGARHKKIWKERFRDIRNSRGYLTRNGIVIRKFFLNVSKKEQKRRFLEGLRSRRRTGSSRRTTRGSAPHGTTTWLPMRT